MDAGTTPSVLTETRPRSSATAHDTRGRTCRSAPVFQERWPAPSTIMRTSTCLLGLLVLGICSPEVPAHGSLIMGHGSSSIRSAREIERNERLYEKVVEQRSVDPARFDRLHPILGELLTDRSVFDYWLNRWQAHPARFERYHPWFWRVIDGESHLGGPQGNPVPLLVPPAGESGNPPSGPGRFPPEPPPPPSLPPTPPPPTAPPVSVPEPGSFLLILEAVGLVLLGRGGLWCLRRG
jgi:hypothetical protein